MGVSFVKIKRLIWVVLFGGVPRRFVAAQFSPGAAERGPDECC